MEKFLAVSVVIIGVMGVLVGLGALMAFPVMFLWNYAATSALGLHPIGFSQAWALWVLCGILFKNYSIDSNSK